MAAPQRKRRFRLDSSLVFMLAILASMMIAALALHGWSGLGEGAWEGASTLVRIGPLVVLGITMAGMIQVLVPPSLVSRWMGEESGFLGILIGIGAGIITPGGPYVSFPIAASLFKSGAGVGPMAAYLTAKNLFPLERTLVYEIPFMGTKFFIAKFIASFALPLLAGLLIPPLLRLVNRYFIPAPKEG